MEGSVIEKFLIGSGDGYSSCSDYGSDANYGCGYGSECGSGSWFGCGTTGIRSNRFSGHGYIFGYGYGYGDDKLSGQSCCRGCGHGSGEGDAFGNGCGDGNKIIITIFKGHKVYTIDKIPCYFVKVHDNYAEVRIIDRHNFEETKAFIGKFNGRFAHGSTIREAIEDAREKYYSHLDFNEAKKQLLGEFEKKGKLTVKELYQWHGILTGSCRFGRSEFQKSHNLKDDDLLSLKEFVNLTEDAFNGEKIRALMD